MTIKEKFQKELAADVAEKAIKNIHPFLGEDYESENKLSTTLATSFPWSETPEGNDYWLAIYKEAVKNGN